MFNVGTLAPILQQVKGEYLLEVANNTVNNVQNFTVPAGVTSICVAVIGSGGSGERLVSQAPYTAAGGGSLTYRNNIAVTPGEILTINSIANNGIYLERRSGSVVLETLAAALHGKNPRQGGNGGAKWTNGEAVSFAGGSGMTGYEDTYNFIGGGAGRFTADGGTATGLGTRIAGANAVGGNLYGEGVTSTRGTQFPDAPSGGAIRIIWGSGRSYPNNSL